MIGEVGSPLLGVVYDAANLLDPDDYQPAAGNGPSPPTSPTSAEHILLGHAKELTTGRATVPPAPACCPGR